MRYRILFATSCGHGNPGELGDDGHCKRGAVPRKLVLETMNRNRKLGHSFLPSIVSTLLQDIRFSLKIFASNPKFTLVAMVTLALGIAVNSTVFSWIDSVLLHPYPGVTDTTGLALIETVTLSGEHLVATSYLDYLDYRDNLKLVSDVAVARFTPLTLGLEGNADRAWAELVSANYFNVLKVKPLLGRSFLPEEGTDKPGAFPVAVISYRMWQNRFHGDRNVLGKQIRLNRHQLTIIGVAPPDFRGSTVGLVYDVWMPITMANDMGSGPTLSYRGCRDLTSTTGSCGWRARRKSGAHRPQTPISSTRRGSFRRTTSTPGS